MKKQTTDQLWAEMAALTQELCKETKGKCKGTGWCCAPMYCEGARDYAKRRGVELKETGHKTLPFCGPEGCTVPPQYRPLCTVHQCCVEMRFDEKSDRYWKLRDKLNRRLCKEMPEEYT